MLLLYIYKIEIRGDNKAGESHVQPVRNSISEDNEQYISFIQRSIRQIIPERIKKYILFVIHPLGIVVVLSITISSFIEILKYS
jgi:hypothetical protein